MFRKLNAIGVLAVCAVLALAFYGQIGQNELPCPLCLLQRIGFAAVLCGLVLNVVMGPRPIHYSIMIIAALFGGAVALRQVSLHVVPGTGSYGAPFLGMHYYTWAFVAFALVVLGSAVMAAFSSQFQEQKFIPFREQSGISKLAIVLAMGFVAANAIVTFAECGPLQCPDDPTSYWLFN